MEPIQIIIVEDDAMVLEVNRQFIESVDGFKIIGTAKNGNDGIELILQNNPQLVILDYYLPDMHGIEVIQQIRMQEQNTDFILVTAARDVETIQQVYRYGAIDYIIKPFRFERLREALLRYEKMTRHLRVNDELDQNSLDKWALTIKAAKADENQLPKGLNQITLKQIYHYMLKAKEPLSAEEVAKGTGLSRVTVRRYLEYLEKIEKLKLEIQYGSVGRPINLYSI